MQKQEKERKESKLSSLYAQRSKLQSKIEQVKKEEKRLKKELEVLQERLAGVQKGIQHLETREILITTHCIERFRERIGPLDAEESTVRTVLLTPQVREMIKVLGSGTYPVYGTIQIAVEDNKIITVIDTNKPK